MNGGFGKFAGDLTHGFEQVPSSTGSRVLGQRCEVEDGSGGQLQRSLGHFGIFPPIARDTPVALNTSFVLSNILNNEHILLQSWNAEGPGQAPKRGQSYAARPRSQCSRR